MIRWQIDPAIVPKWTDEQILDEWNKVTREPGDPLCDALCAGIERRNLDF